MPSPHVTYYVKVADNGYGQNEYFFSGHELAGWEQDVSESFDYHNDCGVNPTGMKIYKFDVSDSTNDGHPFNFSETLDGTHAGGSATALGTGEGVYHCGTAGQADASVKFHVPEYRAQEGSNTTIFPYCSNHPNMGGTSVFTINEISGEECVSGSYECSGCLESTFTGHLNTLINNTNTAQSDIYGNFTTLSYTQATGYETGEYSMGKIIATGTSYSAASGALDSLKTHFSTSGQTINQIAATSSAVRNVNNNSASYSNQASGYNDSLSAYWQGVTGFLDKRFYVNYSPQISGNYTGANTNFSCSETSIQINFDRNRLIYDTTGILNSQPSGENIHQFTAILESVCTGHETTLETSCLKFSEGQQRFGKIVFYPNHKNAWSGDLKAGSYNLKYVSGSFTTALAQHTLGSGTINAEKYV